MLLILHLATGRVYRPSSRSSRSPRRAAAWRRRPPGPAPRRLASGGCTWGWRGGPRHNEGLSKVGWTRPQMEVSMGVPPKWMVYNGQSHWSGWFGGTPILGNHQTNPYPYFGWRVWVKPPKPEQGGQRSSNISGCGCHHRICAESYRVWRRFLRLLNRT